MFLFLRKRIIHMQIIDIQERDYKNYIKNNHALNKTMINHSCYG